MGFEDMKDKMRKIKDRELNAAPIRLRVGLSTCGIAAGADDVYRFLKNEIKKRNINADIRRCGCAGMCYAEPLVEVIAPGMPAVLYGDVGLKAAAEIFEQHVCGKKIVDDHVCRVK